MKDVKFCLWRALVGEGGVRSIALSFSLILQYTVWLLLFIESLGGFSCMGIGVFALHRNSTKIALSQFTDQPWLVFDSSAVSCSLCFCTTDAIEN